MRAVRGNGLADGPEGHADVGDRGAVHDEQAQVTRRLVPVAKARLGSLSLAASAGDGDGQVGPAPSPGANGSGVGHEGGDNGAGASARRERVSPAPVRPVRARVGGTDPLTWPPLVGGPDSEGGNGHATPGLPAGPDTVVVPVAGRATARLRDTDIHTLRLRLKTGEWDYTTAARTTRVRRAHRRPLPFFLMRHRHFRARSRVGHVRRQVAVKRFGSGGAARGLAYVLLGVMLFGVLTMAGGMGAWVAGAAWYMSTLPPVDPENLRAAIAKYGITAQTTKIYDRNGELLYDLVDEETGMRQELTLDQISPLVISATIATEDANFYSNPGVDPVGIVRAVSINLSGEGQSGGSTITQQLVRQVLMSPEERQERTLRRKVKEAVLALQLTQNYSKDEILEMYLNQTYYGHRAYGIEAAARTYFGKSARDLTLPEAALLAGLPQAPSQYDPIINPDAAKRRQAIVLDLMAKQGMITQEQADQAKAENVYLYPYKPVLKAPHWVYYIKEYVEKKYGPEALEAGLSIYTSLDMRVQKAAEQVARDRIEELRRQKATNAAIVVMKPRTGEILAMVGSVDYYNQEIDGQVNVATRERQPGSSFKPITYVTAFKKGWTPATTILDVQTAFPNPGQKPYIPKNYDGRDHGWVTVREALANSYNIPAVKALQFAGIEETIATAHDMGITGLNRGTDWYGLSLTLGGGEVTLLDMTTAYSTFANNGLAVGANPIVKIVDAQNRVLFQLDPLPPGQQVLDPRHAYMITSILSDNRARTPMFGANSPLRTSFPSAAKTGTTDDNRDSWTMGYTPNLTVGVWVGNSDNSEMLRVTGAIGAAVIWHNMMESFYKNPEFVDLVRAPDGSLQREFVQPPGLIRASACSNKGTVTDLFLKEAPPKGCVNYREPRTNRILRSVPGNQPRPRTTPQPRPTPMPGIWPPLQPGQP